MKTNTTFLILLTFFVGCRLTPSTGIVRGSVTDAEGNPLQFITVSTAWGKITTVTNEDGEYELTGILPGSIRIVAFDRTKFDDCVVDTIMSDEEGLLLDMTMKPSRFSKIEWKRVTKGKINIDLLFRIHKDSVLDDFYMSKFEITNQLFLDFLNSKRNSGDLSVNAEMDESHTIFGPRLIDTGFYLVHDSDGTFFMRLGRTPEELKKIEFASDASRAASSDIYYEDYELKIYEGFESHPVRRITFAAALKFAEYYGCLLPTYSQWWRGAFAEENKYWDQKLNGSHMNFWGSKDPYEKNSMYSTTPVGFYDGTTRSVQTDEGEVLFPTNDGASPFGLYDILGNVREYIWDARNEPTSIGYCYDDFMKYYSNPYAALMIVKNIRSDKLYDANGFRIVKPIPGN